MFIVGNELQPVAGRADLGIDLQPSLKLVAVKGAEGAFEGEGHVFDMCSAFGGEAHESRRYDFFLLAAEAAGMASVFVPTVLVETEFIG